MKKFFNWLLQLLKPKKQDMPDNIETIFELPHGQKMHEGPKGIIIHAISQYIDAGHCTQFLKNHRLSYHIIVDTDKVYRCVNLNMIAWHAGVSRHFDVVNLNSSYIGISITVEGQNDYSSFVEKLNQPDWYSQWQYEQLIRIVQEIVLLYKIPLNRVVGHDQVSNKLVRDDYKADPGPNFDWYSFLTKITK